MNPQTAVALAKATLREVLDDEVPSLAAAIAYYTVFALPPLLVVVVAIAGAVAGPAAVQEALFAQLGDVLDADSVAALREMIVSASDLGDSPGSKLAGLAALIVGASGAFGEMQRALNRAWEVERAREGSALRTLIVKRLLSFGMAATIGFLLLVSLAVSAALTALGDGAAGLVGEASVGPLFQLANQALSLGVTTLLFAALFVVLPDRKVAWREVWVGAAVTAVLFTVGKWAIGLYIGTSSPGSAFGAAGSLALILVWIYYSALIVLVGAEFTQVYGRRFTSGSGTAVHPAANPREPQPY